MFEIFKKKPGKPVKKNIFKEKKEEMILPRKPRIFPDGPILPARRRGLYEPFPSPLASSTYDYEMSAGGLQYEMQGIAERNELFTTTRKVISDFQRNVFSNISEGEMDIRMMITCPRAGGPAVISFQLFIGRHEKLMEEKVEYPLSMSNVRRDIDKMITRLMTKVLASLAYTAMYKVIEKVDTL